MTGESHDVGARLRELVLAGDLETLRSYVDGLAGDDLAVARRWVASKHDVDRHPGPPELGDWMHEGTYERYVAMRRARLVSHARLGAPAAAVKAVAAELSFWDNHDQPELVAAFVEKDARWIESFASAADAVRPSAQGASTVLMLLDAVVRAHGLPAPAGALFHEGWIRQLQGQVEPSRWTDREPTLEHLLADPLLPDVVYLQLASGEVGAWPAFGQVLPTLVEKGLIDRDRTLAIALEQLTAGQKPSSQNALVGVLSALGLRADEVPGGLDLLLSILSSCHASAVAPVLALAIESVRTGEDAVELARVVAPRAQKGVRRTLLKALAPDAVGTRVDHAGLLEAVEVLAEADDDLTDRERYDKARAALGGTAGAAPEAPDALGLWDLELPPAAAPTGWQNPWRRPLRDRLWQALRTGSSRDDSLTDDVLVALARGTLTAAEMRVTAHELAAEGALSPVHTVALLEPLFLAGAMQATWAVAVEVADLCAAPPRPASGLDRLLAFLATYAVEVPRPHDLPAHLLRLADGRSKSAQEAGRLATLLGSSREPGAAVPAALGSWTEQTERVPWGLAYPPTRDLGTIGPRIAATPFEPHQVPGAVRRRVLTSLLLDELVALVVEHGAAAVRDVFAGWSESRVSGAFPEAVALWARGELTTASYWTLARATASVDDLLPGWLEEMDPMEAHTKSFQWTVRDGLASAEPVMPKWWSDQWRGAQSWLEFLHTCEALLVAERGGRVVSTTDVSDGSLGLDHLWERLAAAESVGPLDLRLALGRLRPGDLRSVPEAAVEALVDPALSSPDGSRQDRAVDVVQRWVDGGGLRLTPKRTNVPHQWAYDAACPVPWSSCEALAGAPLDDGPPRARADDAYTLPGRPDLWLRQGFHGHDADDSLADVGGPIGVHGWSVVLDHLFTPSPTVHHDPDFVSLVRLQDQGRLDPAVAVRAASARWDAAPPDAADGALGWERAMLRGALRGLWPVAVAIVEAGLARDERPADLDPLVAVLRRRMHEVPPEHVPDFLEQR
ncbi:hypothetical protein Q9S36_46285 [Microbacterium sp. ARD31]|uniref:hypothetical protein n=1 Tax=Microbacterium sp. ARD31 TaxID=2962576 RepID=UPI0028826BA9|nr:hypothetical protein [Microbacterium sp. ARD31]MDT0187620.1 hypothetical protein [Microbacterium sp. ARD31]